MVVHHPQIREALPDSLARRALGPGDPAYRSVSSTYLRGGRPALVLRPTSVAEVVDAVAFAREHRALPLGIRSGGHGVSGRSTNRDGLVIDVSALDGVEVLDEATRRVRIGPGATWKQVSTVLHEHGWAIGSGDYGGVGVGGLATAGGIGYLSRRSGLTIDHVRAAELVLADGTTVRASDTENSDLLWAVRGAGANFGVVTSFELEADELGPVGWAQLTLTTSDLAGSLTRFGQLATSAPRDTTAFLVAGRPHGPETHLALHAVVADPDPDVIVERLTPFLDLGTVVQQRVVVTSYRSIMHLAPDVGPDGHHGFGEPSARSAFLPVLDGDTAQRIEAMLATGQVFFLQLRTMGGAISDVPPDRTAFAHRSPAFQLTGMGAAAEDLDAAWALIEPVSDGLYLSFETRTGAEQVRAAFPDATLLRLIALKHRYDPENLFRDNFNVLVAEAQSPEETRP